jgi:hypothetical protein
MNYKDENVIPPDGIVLEFNGQEIQFDKIISYKNLLFLVLFLSSQKSISLRSL